MFAAAQLDECPEEQKIWGDVLGCTRELIANEKFKDIFLDFCDTQSTETIPITFRDETLKLTDSYFLISPTLEIEALNYQASRFTFFHDERLSMTKEVILDPDKLQDAPDVFRIKHENYKIVISQTVVNEFVKHKFSNVRIEKINQLSGEGYIEGEKYKLNTALFSAADCNEFERVKSMIERGGDINYKSLNGISTLEVLKKRNKLN